MTPIVFRWSVWGGDPDILLMLSHSIATFRTFFGTSASYLVFAESVDVVSRSLRTSAEVLGGTGVEPSGRFEDPRSHWRKWWPAPRLFSQSVEFCVDADIFLLKEPSEVWSFCRDGADAGFLCALEPFDRGFYGNFASRIDQRLPLINAGFLGQHVGSDITTPLQQNYDWWRESIPKDDVQYHDEQGAVRLALESAMQQRRVRYLSKDRYRVVCPLNNPRVESLDGIVMLHATFPDRPAFRRFYREISVVSGIA
jgi:hypothetical protein